MAFSPHEAKEPRPISVHIIAYTPGTDAGTRSEMGISPGCHNGKEASIRSILMPDPIVCAQSAVVLLVGMIVHGLLAEVLKR